MLLTANNRNIAILSNIITTLAQTKVAGQINKSIPIDKAITFDPDSFEALTSSGFEVMTSLQFEDMGSSGVVYTISFYVDPGRTNLLFTDTSSASPQKFTVGGGRLFYAPTDIGLNDSSTISTTKNQSTYYLVVTSTAGLNENLTYDNSANLLFRSVIASSKPNPKFTLNANQAIVVPFNERQINKSISGEYGHMIASFDIYIQQTVFNWSNLSEQDRIQSQQQTANIIRNALYTDRYRGSTCTLYEANLNGTMVQAFKPLASDAVLKGVMRVDTVYWTDGDSNF